MLHIAVAELKRFLQMQNSGKKKKNTVQFPFAVNYHLRVQMSQPLHMLQMMHVTFPMSEAR